jgi:hypothetical protein
LTPASLTPVANLPQVSTTLAKLVEKFAAGVVFLELYKQTQKALFTRKEICGLRIWCKNNLFNKKN